MEDRTNDPAQATESPCFQVVTTRNEGGCIAYLREVNGMSGNGNSEIEATGDLLRKLYQHLDSGQPLDCRRPEPLDSSLGGYVIMLDLDHNSLLLLQPTPN
jgi:hypothetical protein